METSSYKTCIKCQQVKLETEFPYFSTSNAGRKNSCKACNSKLSKIRDQLRKDNPKPSCNTCAICKKTDRNLVLDHDHKTDKFRGWLCDQCNKGIGQLSDDIDTLSQAILYLKNFE